MHLCAALLCGYFCLCDCFCSALLCLFLLRVPPCPHPQAGRQWPPCEWVFAWACEWRLRQGQQGSRRGQAHRATGKGRENPDCSYIYIRAAGCLCSCIFRLFPALSSVFPCLPYVFVLLVCFTCFNSIQYGIYNSLAFRTIRA